MSHLNQDDARAVARVLFAVHQRRAARQTQQVATQLPVGGAGQHQSAEMQTAQVEAVDLGGDAA